ncbi:MAG TPA: hypothetical protein VGJ37_13245 [Pyrinomonadaceae bacterium]|jgi:thioredoxin reductase
MNTDLLIIGAGPFGLAVAAQAAHHQVEHLMPAMQDFGPFFGFTISVRTSAKLICEQLVQQRSS